MSRKSSPLDTFREEALELLADLEQELLRLEADPQNMDTVNAAFRALHTIKGSGAMLDLEIIVGFSHRLEEIFDLLRSGYVGVTKPIVELSLSAKDELERMVRAGKDAEESEESNTILNRFRELLPELESREEESVRNGPRPTPPGGTGTDSDKRRQCFQIHYAPDPDCFRNGGNPLVILQELATLGETLTLGNTGDLPSLNSLAPDTCYLSWEMLL